MSKYTSDLEIFRKYVKTEEKSTKKERFLEGVDQWTSFYRANPHRFVRDYLQLDFQLKWFQEMLLYAMMHNLYVAYIASRGQ